MSLAPLALAVGDPCGVGPQVSLSAALERRCEVPVVLFGDAVLLRCLAAARGEAHHLDTPREDSGLVPLGRVGVVDTGTVPTDVLGHHAPSAVAGRAQLSALDAAIEAVRAGRARGLVTGPTCKEAIVLAGEPFVGQTEHLARRCGLPDDAVTMMFLGPRLRVALVTTHLSVAAAPAEVTSARVERSVRHLAQALARLGERRAELWVTGLNPHAGEGGLFGGEEREVIEPALERLRGEPGALLGFALRGPLAAEAAFRAAARGEPAGIVTMLHDQATIASKLLDWGEAVNVTWGLPFVRTSVDHGVAFDAARAGTADASGMRAALALADVLTRGGDG